MRDEYNDIYGQDFVIVFKEINGKLVAKSECVKVGEDELRGKTNKTDKSPNDILQIAVFCEKCNEYLDYESSDEWMEGKFVCKKCKDEVKEKTVFEQLEQNSRAFLDYEDIYS